MARALLRAVFRYFKFRDYTLGNQLLSVPLLYFLCFIHLLTYRVKHVRAPGDTPSQAYNLIKEVEAHPKATYRGYCYITSINE